MVAPLPRVLLVADAVPPDVAGLGTLLGRSDLKFLLSPMQSATTKLEGSDVNAAVILATPTYLNGHQKELIRLIDALAERQIGAVVLTFSPEDHRLAERLADSDGLMAVPHTLSPDELAGRIAGLAAARPIIDQLQRENTMLRKFDNGLNFQMTQIDEEMRLAARLQADFLPKTLPTLNGCSFSAFFRAASYVSGDIYDACRIDEDHLAFWVADAVGHGVPAALLTIFIKHALETKEISKNSYRIVPPDEALRNLNRELIEQQLSLCQFVTMAYFILNTKTLELQYARAGHPLPMLLKKDGKVVEIEADGALLGVFPGETFPMTKTQLEPGDSLVVYTDGFESAFTDPAGAINERYRTEFAKLYGENAHEKFAEMVKTLDSQEGSLHQRDDLTAVMLHINEDRGVAGNFLG
jgi:serine phosphatase RsbU (regulator of sigma subunit)